MRRRPATRSGRGPVRRSRGGPSCARCSCSPSSGSPPSSSTAASAWRTASRRRPCCSPSAPTPPPRRPRSTSPRSARRSRRASRTGGSATSTGRSSCASACPARSARSPARRSCRTSSTDAAKPVMSLILLALGVYILVRFTLNGLRKDRLGLPLRKRFLAPLGLFAGFVDATGGGGWGPVGTPALLAVGPASSRARSSARSTPPSSSSRIAASLGFLIALGSQGIDPAWVARAAASAASSPHRSPRGSSARSRAASSGRPSAASSS